tara:strand:+ start:7111 stop:7359 length:249 start_codon:yes stop_codon:yes gene_type:complete
MTDTQKTLSECMSKEPWNAELLPYILEIKKLNDMVSMLTTERNQNRSDKIEYRDEGRELQCVVDRQNKELKDIKDKLKEILS